MLTYEMAGITEPEEGIIEFEILPEHLKLIRAYVMRWNPDNYGSVEVNNQRPYGDTNVLANIRHILDDYDVEEADAWTLHNGAGMAFQIIAKTGKFKAAKYRASKYGQDWKEFNEKLRRKKTSKSDSDEGEE